MKIMHRQSIYVWATIFLLLMLLTACDDELATGCSVSDNVCDVTLHLVADNIGTRALDTGTNSEIEKIENTLKDLTVGVYDISGELLDCFQIPLDEPQISTGIPISFQLEEGKYIGRGELTFAIIGNASVYISENYECPPDINTLRETEFSLPSQKEITMLPFYGEKTISYEDLRRNPSLQISLKRRVARIVIYDNLEDGVSIKWVRLPAYTTKGRIAADNNSAYKASAQDKPLEFRKTNEKTFIAYVPETILGDGKDGIGRKIEVGIVKGTEEETHSLWLWPYDNLNPKDNPTDTDSQIWSKLRPNHSYTFSVKSIKESTPEIEVTDNIELRWYGYEYRDGYPEKFTDYHDFITLWVNGNIKLEDYLETNNNIITYAIDINNLNVNFKEIYYQTTYWEDKTDKSYSTILMKDIIQYERNNEQLIGWLNGPDLYTSEYKDLFPTDLPYRIYWISQEVIRKDFHYEKSTGVEITVGECLTDDNGRLYVEFTLKKEDIKNIRTHRRFG